MKIFTPVPWFAALLLSVASAGSTAQTDAQSCADPGSSMLWEVTGGELAGKAMTLHLFGSIHVGKQDFYPLHPDIEQRFRSADNLVFEVDPLGAADPQVALRMQMRGMLPAGQTLPDVLSPQAYSSLQTTLDGLNIPIANFINLKPWMLTLLLANFQANALGYNAQYGLEAYFVAEKAPDSRILELESIEQQVDMLDSIDPELLMSYSLDEFDTSSADMEQLVSAWRCADKAALSATLFDSLASNASTADESTSTEPAPEESPIEGSTPEVSVPDGAPTGGATTGGSPDSRGSATPVAPQPDFDVLYDKLYTQRNLHMADGVEGFIETGSGSWFVVVGSAHLLGEGSVVDLLQQRGYAVTPVTLREPAVPE